MRLVDADELLVRLPDDLPYKGAVKRVLAQAPTVDTVPVTHGHTILLNYWKRTENDKAVLELALSTYGPRLQTLVAIEEMSELQKELVKHERGADNVPHIAEEIADVQIMLDQMTILFDCADAVQNLHSAKVARLAKRLDAEQSAAYADAGEEMM